MRRAARVILVLAVVVLTAFGGHAALIALSTAGTGSLAGLAASTCTMCHR
jgi:hypothetical protein